MTDADRESFHCDTCDEAVPRDAVVRTKTMGGLDPTKFQTFCCPSCGNRLATVFVAEE